MFIVFGKKAFYAIFALLLVLVLRKISTISTARPEGGSDEVSAESLSL